MRILSADWYRVVVFGLDMKQVPEMVLAFLFLGLGISREGLATAQSATAPLNAFPTKRDSNGAAVAGHL